MNTLQPRQCWMSVLAHSRPERLAELWRPLGLAPEYQLIRQPEIGLSQVQARMGGRGNRFFMGDVTITRAVIQLKRHTPIYGYSYVIGRNKPHAELSAVIDALLQVADHHDVLQETVIDTLAAEQEARRRQRSQAIAQSQVDFFTLVRGED